VRSLHEKQEKKNCRAAGNAGQTMPLPAAGEEELTAVQQAAGSSLYREKQYLRAGNRQMITFAEIMCIIVSKDPSESLIPGSGRESPDV